jgi:hypothetical protein
MKHSEKLAIEASEQDSDYTYMKLKSKSMREARLEKFEDGYSELLEKQNCIIIPFNGTKIVIDTQSKHGVIDYFPKANKLLIRSKNKWHEQGLKWINSNLINNKK